MRQPVFVTRKFPPSIGGMETLAAGVWNSMYAVRADAIKISHGGSNLRLIWWAPACVLRLAWLCLRGRAECVLCGDALTNALCAPVVRIFRVPCATMIHGLDITYDSWLYRVLALPPLRRCKTVIANSSATAQIAREHGVQAGRVAVLTLGVELPQSGLPGRQAAGAALRQRLSLPQDAVLVGSVGRLVRRKGVRWFTEAVLPLLDEHVHYVVAGQGAEEPLIRVAAETAGVAKRVHLLGQVSDEVREELMSGADVFVAPNISVAHDVEGFGLAAVEAAVRDTPVVAADIDGVKDAVVPGRTGILVPAEDAAAWAGELGGLLGDPAGLVKLGARFGEDARGRFGQGAMGLALAAHLGLRTVPSAEGGGSPSSGHLPDAAPA